MKQTLFDEKKYTALSGDSEPDFTSVEDIKQYPEYQTVKKIYNSLTTNKDRRKFAFAKDCYFITNDFIIFKIKSTVSAKLVNKSSVVRSDFISQCNNLFKVAKENKDTSSKTIIQSKEAVKTVKKYNKIISELGETLYCCLNSRKSNGMITFNPDLIEAAFANLNNSYDVCLSKLNKGLNVLYINSLSVEIILCSIVSENLDNAFILNLTTYSFVKNDCTENYIAYLENVIPENNEKVEIHRKIGDIKAFYDYNNKSKIYDELYTALTGKKSKAVFYDTTPDKTKLDLFKFVSTDDLRPVLQTVGYQNGYAAATDSYILVWVKDQWIKEREGNCYDRLGNKSQYNFVDFHSVVPDPNKDKYTEIQLDTNRLKQAVELAKKLPKGKKDYPSQICKVDNDAYFAAKFLERILYFLVFCTNPKIYLIDNEDEDYKSKMYITDKNGVHNCILMCVKGEGLKYYVDYKTLKYCVDFYSITYNKDYDKILSTVKGNCVSLDLLRAELALLEDEKLSGVDSGIDTSISRGLMGLSDFQKNSQNILGIIKKKVPLQRSKISPKFAVGSFVRFREFDGTIYKILSADTDGYTIVDLSMPLHCTNSLSYEYENDLIECNLQILELLLCE